MKTKAMQNPIQVFLQKLTGATNMLSRSKYQAEFAATGANFSVGAKSKAAFGIVLALLCFATAAAAVPATPTSPSPGTTSSPGPTQANSTVTLSWGASSGATFYDLGIRDIASGILVVNTTTTATSYTAALTPGKQYRWNVAAGNSTGESAFTTVLFFQTPAAIVIPSTPTSPSPGTTSSPGPTQSSSTVTFTWSAVAGATFYDIGVRDIATGNLVVNTTTTAMSYTATLTPGRQYRWNVAAGNSAGESAFTAVLYFQTPTSLLPPPTLNGPADGATGVSTTPTFSWSTVSGANRYWFICSPNLADLPTDTSATSCAGCVTSGLSGNTDQTSYTPPTSFPYNGTTRTLNPNTLYYWKIQGWNTSGIQGNYSSVRTFTTAAAVTPLAAPTLVSPGNGIAPGLTVSTVTPTFQWQAVDGADGYALYIGKFNGSTYDLVFDSSTIGGPLTGTSYNLPSGYLLNGGQYRWNMGTHNSAGYGSPNVSRLYFSTAASGGTFYLSFPLANRTSATAKINSVFDHSMTSAYTADQTVVAFTGEAGTVLDSAVSPSVVNGVSLYSYKKSNGTAFVVNGNYSGAGTPATLNYDGHSGYDFKTTDQAANGQINVYAAADGVAHWGSATYNTIYIDHGNGYATFYLHLSQRIIADGTSVSRGQLIGVSGDTGAPGSPHLHFEVRLGGANGIPVDPYGWTGAGSDPYTSLHPGVVNVDLWNPASLPCSYSLSSLGNSFGSGAATGSFNITAAAGCSWTAATGNGWIAVNSGSSGSGNGSVSYSVSANASANPRTGTITVQSETYTITQAGVSTPLGYPSATWVGPAATGNYETGRSGNSISKIIVHTTEGTAQGALSRFQLSGESASAHYIISTSGVIWQVVADSDTAYHCGNYAYNQQSIGIELEGYADGNPAGNFSWQTDAQFTALQNLISWLRTQYSIPLDRAHIIAHNQVPSPGSPYPPTTQWGGASNHHDNGAWWNWRRVMTALGHAPSFSVLNVQSASSITTLPQSGAPIIMPAAIGQRIVAYDSYGGYYLVFVCGSETSQDFLPTGGEFHWDGWIPAANVTVLNGATQLEVTGAFPQRLNVRSSPTTSASIVAHTIDGKRHVATGNTANADGYTWREFYLATTNNTIVTGWAINDNLTAISSGGGGASSPTITNPKITGKIFTLNVPTQIGYNYTLEFKNSIRDANWTAVQTLAGTGGTITLTDSGAADPNRLYRVRIQ